MVYHAWSSVSQSMGNNFQINGWFCINKLSETQSNIEAVFKGSAVSLQETSLNIERLRCNGSYPADYFYRQRPNLWWPKPLVLKESNSVWPENLCHPSHRTTKAIQTKTFSLDPSSSEYKFTCRSHSHRKCRSIKAKSATARLVSKTMLQCNFLNVRLTNVGTFCN